MSTQHLQMEGIHFGSDIHFWMVYDMIRSYEWIPKDTCYDISGVCEDHVH